MTNTGTAARAARWTFVELAHAEALLLDLGSRYLSYDATPEQARAFFAPIDQAAAWRDAEVAALTGHPLCRKCSGTGMTQWRHRSGGTCYSCNGDGWSAKGRKTC